MYPAARQYPTETLMTQCQEIDWEFLNEKFVSK